MRAGKYIDLQVKSPSLVPAFNQNCITRQLSVEVPNIKFNKNSPSSFDIVTHGPTDRRVKANGHTL
jgi:hypothetical protein